MNRGLMDQGRWITLISVHYAGCYNNNIIQPVHYTGCWIPNSCRCNEPSKMNHAHSHTLYRILYITCMYTYIIHDIIHHTDCCIPNSCRCNEPSKMNHAHIHTLCRILYIIRTVGYPIAADAMNQVRWITLISIHYTLYRLLHIQ